MSKPLIIIVALYVFWRLLSTFGRSKRKSSRDGVRGRGSRRDEDYKDLTKQESPMRITRKSRATRSDITSAPARAADGLFRCVSTCAAATSWPTASF